MPSTAPQSTRQHHDSAPRIRSGLAHVSGRSLTLSLLFLALLVGGVLPASAATWYVRVGGSDLQAGDSAATAFRSLRRAAAVLNHGDTLIIGPGRYTEATLIADRVGSATAPLRILGDESGELTGDTPGPVILSSPNPEQAALRLYRVADAELRGLSFAGPGPGLWIERSHRVRVLACSATGCRQGFTLERSEAVAIGASVVDGGVIGVRVRGSVATTLDHLTVVRCTAVAVQVLGSGAGEVRSSLFTANATNFVADSTSAPQWGSDYNVLNGLSGPWGEAPPVVNPYEWTAMTGLERHSLYITPGFVAPDTGDLRIAPEVTWPGGLPGANVGAALPDWLTTDRDGKAYPSTASAGATAGAGWRSSVGAYAYPTPVAAPGWQRLDATVNADGVRFSAALYAADGVKLRSLVDDVPPPPALWWDGRDDSGTPVAGDASTAWTLRSATHDLRLVDDGAVGDNGTALGVYQGDNVDRVLALPDGRIVGTSSYDEASIAWRLFNDSGLAHFGATFREGMFWGVGGWPAAGIVGGVNAGATARLVLLELPGRRIPLPGDREFIAIYADDEPAEAKKGTPADLLVLGDRAYVSLPHLDQLRVFDLRTGTLLSRIALPAPRGLTAAADGGLWATSGTDLVHLDADGAETRRLPSGLEAPEFLDARAGRLVVVDRAHERLRVLAEADGALVAELGQARTGWYMPVSGRLLRDPRDVAWLADGRLMVSEQGRQRAIWPETGAVDFEAVSNFMESAVVHPTDPRYVYVGAGIYDVDPSTGAWRWVVESPSYHETEDGPTLGAKVRSPSQALVLGGRPCIVYFASGELAVADVTDPLAPRVVFNADSKLWPDMSPWAYGTLDLLADGTIVFPSGPQDSLQYTRIPFTGFDAAGLATWDYANRRAIGPKDDPTGSGLKSARGISADRSTGDIYFLAKTERFAKMVPGWGADGTGIGRSAPDGSPLWFSLSSGGNYMSVSALHDTTAGDGALVVAGKSFGGQLDLFDAHGLRLATGNWSWPTGHGIGFVDLRFGVHTYRRPDGKLGVYVEDDAIGRFARARLEGADTVRRSTAQVRWTGPLPSTAAEPIGQDRSVGRQPQRVLDLARVDAPLPLDDWSAWTAAGVLPQLIALPSSVGFQRNWQEDLMQTYRAGTFIGAMAHDGAALYVCFLAADDTPIAPTMKAAELWTIDSFELWVEEEQFGLGLLRDDSPAIHKWRQHNAAGENWKANYRPAGATVWGQRLASLAAHPLGRQLEAITGVSYARQPGYIVSARIPLEEVKLVGGIAGRGGDAILPATGQTGEVLRIAVSMNNVDVWGGMQEYMIDWPTGKMFADPTRSQAFRLK